MLNKRGQALVEFVIILPIFILLILGVIDFGRIMYSKMNLEEQMSDVVDYYKKGKNIEEIKDKFDLASNDIKIDVEDEFINIKLSKSIDIITPGLQLILNSPYSIETKGVF